MSKSSISLFAIVFLMAMNVQAPAHAYLDPGTGSMLIQLVLGGVAGAMVVVRLYWQRVKEFFSFKRPPTSPE